MIYNKTKNEKEAGMLKAVVAGMDLRELRTALTGIVGWLGKTEWIKMTEVEYIISESKRR